MKSVEDLKQRLADPEFVKLFANANSADDILKIAKEQGYDITLNDIENYEISDDMLEAVAGGKSGKTINNYYINGNGNMNVR